MSLDDTVLLKVRTLTTIRFLVCLVFLSFFFKKKELKNKQKKGIVKQNYLERSDVLSLYERIFSGFPTHIKNILLNFAFFSIKTCHKFKQK